MSDIRYHEDHDWLACIDCDDDFCVGDCSICYREDCEDRYEDYEGDKDD